MSTFPDQFRLDGRTALITGSGRGLGWEMAKGAGRGRRQGAAARPLGTSGWRPGSASSRPPASPPMRLCLRHGRPRRDAQVEVARAGPIDILVHNVGERDRRPFADIEPDDFARLIDVDLSAAHALVKLVVPGMIERGWGRLILVTSIVADLAVPGASSYIAAKGGLSALARALAAELGGQGITSNALSPGFFATETNAQMIASPAGERTARALPGQALGRAVGDRRGRGFPRLAGGVLRQRPHAHRRWRRVGDVSRLMPGFDSTRDALSQGIVAAILVGVFALLAADRVHRVLIPIGAVALVWLISYFTPFRLISFEAAQQAVDLNVILLLFAMMALVGVLKTTNVFPWAVDRLLERSRGNPSRAARLIIWFTGVLSAILDNVTTVIFTYPMASEMARRLRINGSAFFLPMVMAANIGGTATLIGDPPNVLIGADPRTGLVLHVVHLPPHRALHLHDDRAGLVQPALLSRRHRPRRRRRSRRAPPSRPARCCRTCRCCARPAGSRC